MKAIHTILPSRSSHTMPPNKYVPTVLTMEAKYPPSPCRSYQSSFVLKVATDSVTDMCMASLLPSSSPARGRPYLSERKPMTGAQTIVGRKYSDFELCLGERPCSNEVDIHTGYLQQSCVISNRFFTGKKVTDHVTDLTEVSTSGADVITRYSRGGVGRIAGMGSRVGTQPSSVEVNFESESIKNVYFIEEKEGGK
ncbi:hypothetical protein BC830DRAFT_805259 [Chytriomyces sp. MP71]|nr:hypothetical protein BC830DRAFT_805259 [Chytriomyces sp. MP71]